MQRFGKHSAAAQRQAERRRREDEAPRLSAEVPDLKTLRLEITEQGDTFGSQPKYVRTIMVDSAPALFLLPCGDTSCIDGGHDVTREMVHALRSHRTSFTGDDACSGSIGSASCTRVLHYTATAEYTAKEGG